MPYSQLLTFQADGATLLQLVAPCGTRRLSPATILSTVGFHQRLDLGLHLRAARDCHLPAAGVFLVARGFVDRSREEPFPRRPFRANVRVADDSLSASDGDRLTRWLRLPGCTSISWIAGPALCRSMPITSPWVVQPKYRHVSYGGTMAAPVRKLIFDTSAINKLRKDQDAPALLTGLGLVYHIGITETAISEVIATADEAERDALLNTLKRLLACGSALMPFNWIIERQAEAYQRDPSGFDWRQINIRVKAAEEEIARQKFVHDVSAQTRKEQKALDTGFQQIFRDAEPAFQKLFLSGQERPSLKEVTEHLIGAGGAHREIGAGLFERATGTRPDEATIQNFIERCPPFRAPTRGPVLRSIRYVYTRQKDAVAREGWPE